MGSYTIEGEPYHCPKCGIELLMNPAERKEHIDSCVNPPQRKRRKNI